MKIKSILLCVIVALLIAACGSSKPVYTYNRPTEKTIFAKDFVTVNKDWVCSSSYGYMTFTGTVTNISEYDLKYVEIRGTVYDTNGGQINTDTGFIDSDILAHYKSSTFEIMVKTTPEGKKCKVAVEDAWFDQP